MTDRFPRVLELAVLITSSHHVLPVLLSENQNTLILIHTHLLIETCVLLLELTRSTNTLTLLSSYSSFVFVFSSSLTSSFAFRAWQFTGTFSIHSPFHVSHFTTSPSVPKPGHAAPRKVLATHHHFGGRRSAQTRSDARRRRPKPKSEGNNASVCPTLWVPNS